MLRENKLSINSYLVKQLPVATAFLNLKLEVVHASDKWIKLLSFDHSVFGKTIHDIFNPVSEEWEAELKKCIKAQPSVSIVQRVTINKKNEKWFNWSNIPWYDDNENIIGVITTVEDITESILTELRLEKTEFLLKEKSEIAKIGSWELDLLTDEVKWCEMTRAIHEVEDNYEPTLESGINFYKEGHSRNTISMVIYEAVQNGEPWCEKLQIITGRGHEKWVIAAGKPIYKNDKLISLVGTFQDINEQVVTNAKTKESEQLLKTLIDHIPVHVYLKDLDSRKILVNKAAYEFLGASSAEEVIGQSDFDHYPKESAELNRKDDLTVLTTLKPILNKQILDPKRTGSDTTFLTSKIPLIDDDGIAYGLVGLSLDITNMKRKEEELRNLIDVTSLQNKKLINFAHIVSHNLRSHTANFSMLLDFLSNENDETEKLNIIGMLTDASNNLLDTLDNLNDVVAISSNNLKSEKVNFTQALERVKQNLSAVLLKNKATIVSNVEKNVDINVVPAYADNIITNFITNAVKYKFPTRNPIITINSEKLDDYTVISIEDNGIGLDLNKYGDKLFGMYKTFHNRKNAKGIGLYIVKNQVESMNGKITVESEVGKGTSFKIYFNEKN